jgi:hypothetical protein
VFCPHSFAHESTIGETEMVSNRNASGAVWAQEKPNPPPPSRTCACPALAKELAYAAFALSERVPPIVGTDIRPP